jgi:hypothetical protein
VSWSPSTQGWDYIFDDLELSTALDDSPWQSLVDLRAGWTASCALSFMISSLLPGLGELSLQPEVILIVVVLPAVDALHPALDHCLCSHLFLYTRRAGRTQPEILLTVAFLFLCEIISPRELTPSSSASCALPARDPFRMFIDFSWLWCDMITSAAGSHVPFVSAASSASSRARGCRIDFLSLIARAHCSLFLIMLALMMYSASLQTRGCGVLLLLSSQVLQDLSLFIGVGVPDIFGERINIYLEGPSMREEAYCWWYLESLAKS